MPRIDKQWIQQRIHDREISQGKIAQALQRHRSMVTHLLNGRRPLRIHEATIFADLLDVPVSEICERFGVKAVTATSERAPLAWSDVDGEITPPRQGYDRRTARPAALGADYEGVRLLATGRPEIDGWTCFYSPGGRRIDAQAAAGRLSVCELTSGRKRIGKLIPVARGRWDAISIWNGATVAGAEIIWAAPVVLIACPV